jgi:hypothetical protein
MGRTERLQLIRDIETVRGSRMLVYITGDRRGLETKIATDIFPFCLNHLSQMGFQDKIDLYLYSTGGITMAGFGLVNLIREFCKSFCVIIPFKALSCATLIALGADEIIMTKMGQLSPIDPSISSPLGPHVPIPGPPGATQAIPLNVEDVISYLDLARKQLQPDEDKSLMARVFDRLSQAVHPLALGSVNRIREQISFLAKTLLSRHMTDERKIDKIVETIIRGRFSHDYLISRKEAKELLELPVADVSLELDEKIVKLYTEYDAMLELSAPYYPEMILGNADTAVGSFNRAIIESDNLTHVFRTIKEIKRVLLGPPTVPAPTIGYQERILSEGWMLDNNI